MKKMTRFMTSFMILAQLASSPVIGQRRASSITGRVTGDSGQPLANVAIFLRKSGTLSSPGNSILTDEDGRFHADDLVPGVYSIVASLNGFVVTAYSPERKTYRVGDSVSIQMTRGGVITGTVTTHAGEPVIAARAIAILVRDSRGRPVRSGAGGSAGWTDDRGIYRIYGLPAGFYLVAINGSQFYNPAYGYEGDIPVFHPSSTRDAAKEVSLQIGQEVTGIDIRYRSERGHAISGTFAGSTGNDRPEAVLMNAASSTIQARSFNASGENARSFALYGLPDGDYQLIGQSYVGGEGGSVSAPRRVTVKGADVTGVELALTPLGSVTGRITLETLKEAERGPDCKDKQGALLEETEAVIRRDQHSDKDAFTAILYSGSDGALNDKGEFAVFRLIAGRYYIDARLPSEDWFIRSVTLPGTTRAKPTLDIVREGLNLTAGQRVAGVVVTAAEGAAALRGKVVPASEGASLPANLRAHLVPAERESADDVTRFAETLVNSDGSFSLTNIAPGRYFIMARAIADDEWMDRTPRPVVWDATARARLRQEMETANALVELRQCQRVADYELKYATPLRPKPPVSKRKGQD